MSQVELGMFEDDYRSQAGAEALALLDAQMQASHPSPKRETSWASSEYMDGLDNDPMTVAARAAVRAERTFDAYRQSGAWTMQEGVEVDLSKPVQ